MTVASASGNWRSWQWGAWLGATVVATVTVGALSLLVYEFADVCGAFDNPVARPVHEVQARLAGLVAIGFGVWVLAAVLTGRRWGRACVSALVTVALPAALLLVHLTVASWASVGSCSF